MASRAKKILELLHISTMFAINTNQGHDLYRITLSSEDEAGRSNENRKEECSTSTSRYTSSTSCVTSGNCSNFSDDCLSDFDSDDSQKDKDYVVETSSDSEDNVSFEN
ncbi:hypothetical protein FQR65_LT09786 [Abscondita terminalis]|nr:hypothetical protein FQR65_LT09786 [Abscondita terminalis]